MAQHHQMMALSSALLGMLVVNECTRPALSFSAIPAKKPIVVVGSVNADIFVNVGRLPLQGETLKGTGGYVAPGGKGANQAVAASRLGAPVSFAGIFGSDTHATMLRSTMQEAGVNTELSGISDGPSGQAIILLEPDAMNSIVLIEGANGDWPAVLPSPLKQAITEAGYVLLQREVPERVNIEVARHAKENGVSVLMDVGGDDGPLPSALLECITCCCPNETELNILTDMPTDSEEKIEAAARKLQSFGVREVLVTLGKDGSMVPSSPPCLPHPPLSLSLTLYRSPGRSSTSLPAAPYITCTPLTRPPTDLTL